MNISHKLRKHHVVSRGFTLIEILVVIFIIGLLASVISVTVIDKISDANIAKAKADIRSLESALDIYRLDKHVYPSTDEGLEILVEEGHIKSLSKDPWGKEYQYLNPGQNAAVDIYTLGLDGTPGGEGENADIGNWNLDE